MGVGARLAAGTAVVALDAAAGPEDNKPGAAGGNVLGGNVLGGNVLGGRLPGKADLGLVCGDGGKSPCCALTRSDMVVIATMTPVGTSAGNVAATVGQDAA